MTTQADTTRIVYPVYTTALRRPWRLWNVRMNDVVRGIDGTPLSWRSDDDAAEYAKRQPGLYLQQSHPET